MVDSKASAIVRRVIARDDSTLLDEWMQELHTRSKGGGRIAEAELRAQAAQFIRDFRTASTGSADMRVGDDSFASVREMLSDVSRARAMQGFSPTDTANFVLALKRPLITRLGHETFSSQQELVDATETLTFLLDQLALFTTEVFQRSREEILMRQQQEIAELSTPVVKLWEGILALPLIGTLDSARTQVVMETLLQAIVDQSAAIAIIDITGVPTVDTLVAQHLLKTVSAARLMGADCIISGIRPQIAQTMIHLGVELNVASKASLADAFALALKQTNRTVVRVREGRAREPS
jgi:rsbT co-antagonist protein RsbR